jgi:hypothetical protein
MARLKPREAVVHLREQLTGEARRRRLVALSYEVIAKAEAINRAAIGHDVGYETIVDGRPGAPIDAVKPGGVVAALFAVHAAAIDFTWETLARLSPLDQNPKTIDNIVYRDNHLLLVNGEEREAPVSVEPDDVVTFVNLLPYARRIEQGYSKKQAPDGVYEAAAAIVKARFGNIVDVRFGYGSFLGATASRDTRYPFISLSPKRRR